MVFRQLLVVVYVCGNLFRLNGRCLLLLGVSSWLCRLLRRAFCRRLRTQFLSAIFLPFSRQFFRIVTCLFPILKTTLSPFSNTLVPLPIMLAISIIASSTLAKLFPAPTCFLRMCSNPPVSFPHIKSIFSQLPFTKDFDSRHLSLSSFLYTAVKIKLTLKT